MDMVLKAENNTQKISSLTKWSIFLGNMFEHYDTALFSILSPFLAPLFFPGKDPVTALFLTYCIIPLGMIVRPIGSLFFGYIGDRYGRKKALIISLSGMAVATACIGFLPTHQHVGILAPVLLSLGRIFQNFFASGETMGGAICLIEGVPEKQKDMTSSYFNASTIAGILLASFGVSILCGFNVVQDCWRILYFLGCSTAIFAIFLRAKMVEPNHLNEMKKSNDSSLKFILTTCWDNRQALFTIAIAAGFSYACYTLALVTMNGFIPLVTSITKEKMLHLNSILLCMDFLLLPFFGFVAQKFSREKVMIASGLIAAITGVPLLWFLDGTTLLVVIVIRFLLVIIGVSFSAPFNSWAQQLVDPSHRYTVISFAYAIGSQIFGGPSAAIALWLFQKTNWIPSIGIYWMGLGLLTACLIAKQHSLLRRKVKAPCS